MLSQACGYASTALAYVAAAGGRSVLVKEIAEAASIPAPYLAKIVQVLARKHLVRTQRGIGGGVALAREARSITLYDLAVALDDPAASNRCMLGTATCSDDRACPCHDFWKTHKQAFVQFLHATTIADLAVFETRKRWRNRFLEQGLNLDVLNEVPARGIEASPLDHRSGGLPDAAPRMPASNPADASER